MEPHAVVAQLIAWAERTEWVETLELGGSLGRDAGDAWSDVDAGAGLAAGETVAGRLDEVRADVSRFGPVAGFAIEEFGAGAVHLSVLYRAGLELSLVVTEAGERRGLAPQTRALVDKCGRLAETLPAERWQPSEQTAALWGYQAWTLCKDAARHAVRGRGWRSLDALTKARERVWRLWAARQGLVYPQFGAVTVENADAAEPEGIAATHPSTLEPVELVRATRAVTALLRALSIGEPAVADAVERRIAEVTAGVA
ncbi:hypothetical protein [Gryllotalpicola ginsengisoli]|uniref:hypothetical protein n=1 Tax=Gryllotalpicola ginsengisoli TaxID=444608 RepID=UPI0003B3140D|nr:hypothetical protein [Gryllotalpicola ginsengisoli]